MCTGTAASYFPFKRSLSHSNLWGVWLLHHFHSKNWPNNFVVDLSHWYRGSSPQQSGWTTTVFVGTNWTTILGWTSVCWFVGLFVEGLQREELIFLRHSEAKWNWKCKSLAEDLVSFRRPFGNYIWNEDVWTDWSTWTLMLFRLAEESQPTCRSS